MSPHVFISYSRQDQAFVLKLKEDLEKHALEVWIDQSDLIPSQTWLARIKAALDPSMASDPFFYAQTLEEEEWRD